jgi:hypothetical protein
VTWLGRSLTLIATKQKHGAMMSCASLIKSNKTRQGNTLHMHRRGDTVAKQVKK